MHGQQYIKIQIWNNISLNKTFIFIQQMHN